MQTLLLSLAFVFTLGMAWAQAPAGRQQFESRCSRCHGGDATGGETGPNIVAQIGARSDADLAAFLRTGRPSSGMPAFDLLPQDMSALVAYLRVLASNVVAPLEVRKTVQLVDGQKLEGRVLNEGMSDLQMLAGDRRIRLLRKAADGRYREVTSQTDWSTYHGDSSGNRFT